MTRKIGFLTLLGLALVGCGASESDRATSTFSADKADTSTEAVNMAGRAAAGGPSMDGAGDSGAAAKAATAEGGAVNPQLMTAGIEIQQRAVVRNATLQLRVESVEEAEKKVNAIIESLHGYVDNVTSTDLASDKPVLTVNARIPVDGFARGMEEFEKLGVRLGKSVRAEDVTEKLVDMDARLKTMLAQEDTYRGMLREQHNMTNVVQLQQELMELRSQIESIAAQRKSLGGLAALSTVQITLQQKSDAVAAATKDSSSLGESWSEAWTSATTFFRSALVAVFWVLAFSPAWILALVGALYVRKHVVRPRSA